MTTFNMLRAGNMCNENTTKAQCADVASPKPTTLQGTRGEASINNKCQISCHVFARTF